MKANNRSAIGVIAAVLLALVGGVLLFKNSGDAEVSASEAPVEQAEVLVATRDIGRGESAADMSENAFAYVRIETIPADELTADMLTTPEQLDDLALGGNVTARGITEGTRINLNQFIVPGQQATSALPSVDDNLFEVTTAIEPQRALGGNVRAGQYVAVVASFDPAEGEGPATVVILENVLVTNVQTETLFTAEQLSSDPLAPSLAPTSRLFITFGVPVNDLERLTYANEFGRIWLARQGDAAVIDGTKVQTRDTVVVTITGSTSSSLADDSVADDSVESEDGAE